MLKRYTKFKMMIQQKPQRRTLAFLTMVAGSMLLPAALACTSVGPTESEVQALKQLENSGHVVACSARSQGTLKRECVQYRKLSPQQAAAVIAQSVGVQFQQKGKVWLIKDVQNGRLTRVSTLGTGSLAETTDRESAYEVWSKRLNNHPKKYDFHQWKDCKAAGLDKTGPVKIKYCQVLLASKSQPVLQFEVTRSFDKSMPKGVYRWFTDTGSNCGGRIVLKESKEKRRRK